MNHDSTELPAALRARLAAHPLRDFALTLYARPGVEAACLRLQDEAGVDVCELLWRCWLFHHGVMPAGEPAGLADVRHWQCEVTGPLRILRRALKSDAQSTPGVATVRDHLKRAELAAELETLSRLQVLSEKAGALIPLSTPPPGLEIHLADCLQLQKKSHLLALKAFEARLDPSGTPR